MKEVKFLLVGLLLIVAICKGYGNPEGNTPLISEEKQEPVPVKSNIDLVYAKYGDREMKLDLYVPEDGEGPFPIVVWIHGGGWTEGDKKDCLPLNFGYCQKGYATASLSYRFINVAPFPAQIEDCKAAIRWLKAHSKEYNIDPNHIGVWGGSAGGHLACLLGVTGKTKKFDVGDHLDQTSEVHAICNYFGPTDFLSWLDYLESNADLTNLFNGVRITFLGGQMEEKVELAKEASPTTFVDQNAAPFIHIHGTVDIIVPVEQAEKLHDKLRAANVWSRLFLVPRAGHNGEDFFNPKLLEEVQLFFDTNLKNKPPIRCFTKNDVLLPHVEISYEFGPEMLPPVKKDKQTLRDGKTVIDAGTMKTAGFLRCRVYARYDETETGIFE